MLSRNRSGRRIEDGQAMVELVIVAAFVLVPVFLAIPIIGKYLDLRTATAEASRYAAWERTVWYGGPSASSIGWLGAKNTWRANAKTDGEIGKEVAVRLLSNSGATDAFLASDKNASGFKNGTARRLWSARDGSALLTTYEDIGGSVGNEPAPGTLNKILDPIANLAATLGPFTLEMKGEYTASVTVKVQDFDRMTFLPVSTKLTFSETNVLLANGWNAGGPNDSALTPAKRTESGLRAGGVTDVMSQVKGLTPTSILDNGITNIITTILSVVFPEFAKLELGKIDPDVVPEDRVTSK